MAEHPVGFTSIAKLSARTDPTVSGLREHSAVAKIGEVIFLHRRNPSQSGSLET